MRGAPEAARHRSGEETGRRRGLIDVGANASVVLAAGTIENARLALDATGDEELQRVGTRFTTHLRSNLTVRLDFPDHLAGSAGLGTAAIAVRGAAGLSGVRFHHQITSFALGAVGPEEFRDLFASTPRHDVESLDRAHRSPPKHLVITVASVAEMASELPGRITLSDATDEFGVRRALVEFELRKADQQIWSAMDKSADEVVAMLSATGEI